VCKAIEEIDGDVLRKAKDLLDTMRFYSHSVGIAAPQIGELVRIIIVDASKSLVKWDKEYFPNSENSSKYKALKEQWQEVYAHQLELVDRGLVTSMWKAPGL